MPATPIPIITDRITPGHSSTFSAMSSTSPSSSISISPQTPFNNSASLSIPATSAMCTSPSNPGFFKWATAAAQLAKSPPAGAVSPPADSIHQRGFDIPAHGSQGHGPGHGHGRDEHDHENHDSFEFGDFDDLRSRSWSKTRRAASMSAGPGSAGGITSMISGFGASSPPSKSEMLGSSASSQGALGAMAVPSGGVLADKNSKGQGVLRRLSLSGSSFTRPGFLSPPSNSIPLASPPAPATQSAIPASFPTDKGMLEPPQAEPVLQRANTVSGGMARGRRNSDSGKKRGVSPMGERLLRDHGHF